MEVVNGAIGGSYTGSKPNKVWIKDGKQFLMELNTVFD